MQQRARQRELSPPGVAVVAGDHGKTQSDQNDADIFDAVIREQAFQIVLPQRERDAQHGADHTERGHRPAGSRRRGQPAAETHEAVNAHLDGHAGKHGGNVAGRVGVSGRQPDVQRKNTGLQSEAHKRQPEQRGEFRPIPHGAEFPAAGARREQREKCEEAQRADVRRREIQPAGVADLALVALQRDEKVSADSVNFPRDQKVQSVR